MSAFFLFMGFMRAYGVLPHEERAFVEWMRENNEFFTGNEYHFRFGIFLVNQRFVDEHNRGKSSFKVCMNQFACYTDAEYKSQLGFRRSGPIVQTGVRPPETTEPAPLYWDWRDHNVVNPIRSSGKCMPASWAFAACEAQESQWAKEKGELVILSPQNLIDCVKVGCSGCHGGDQLWAYNWVDSHQKGRFVLEDKYGFEGKDSSCKWKAEKGVCPFKSYWRPTTTQNETELMIAVWQYGVMAISIDGSLKTFLSYKGGIYDGGYDLCHRTALDHSCCLIGYGVETGRKFWIVKNQWGTQWGEDGYARIARDEGNICGVATDVLITSV
jgi:cathepsin L